MFLLLIFRDYLASREAMDNYRTEQDDLRKRKDVRTLRNSFKSDLIF